MPTYEYVCLSCGRHTEAVQTFSDEPLRTCPHCGGPLRRVFHPVGIVLKGSGFYSTDNRGGSKHRPSDSKEAKKEGASAETSSSGSTGSESSSDTSSSTSTSDASKRSDAGSKSSSSKSKPKKS